MQDSDPKRQFDWWSAISIIPLTGGIVLILLSLIWPTAAVSHGNWSPEKAKQYQSAAVKLHSLSHASLHASPDADQQAMRNELQQAEKDYQAIRSQLDSAIERPKHLAWALRVAGVALAISGGFAIYRGRAPAA
jgi:hypothetical protein